jgi:hypothetical protein
MSKYLFPTEDRSIITIPPFIVGHRPVQGIPWTTESSLPGPDENMLAATNNALHGTQASTEMAICQFCYYAVSDLYGYHCTCNWCTKSSSVCFCS